MIQWEWCAQKPGNKKLENACFEDAKKIATEKCRICPIFFSMTTHYLNMCNELLIKKKKMCNEFWLMCLFYLFHISETILIFHLQYLYIFPKQVPFCDGTFLFTLETTSSNLRMCLKIVFCFEGDMIHSPISLKRIYMRVLLIAF